MARQKLAKNQKITNRRRSVVKRLEAQLQMGTKITKDRKSISLTDKDISRISSEILTVKNRI